MSSYLAHSLGGVYAGNTKKYLAVVSRLIDKAKTEYLLAREAALAEEEEGGLSYNQIEKRNQGQFLYTIPIVNHLENCLNALARIYKILDKIPNKHNNNKKIIDLRNAIEHMDERISRAVDGSVTLNVSEDASKIDLLNEHIVLNDLAAEIRSLNKEIIRLLQT